MKTVPKSENISKVSKESQIDHIVTTKKDQIVVIMFTYDSPQIRIIMKRKFAQDFNNCYFALAFLDKPGEKKYEFVIDRDTYITQIENKVLPYVFFYFNGTCVDKFGIVNFASIFKKLHELCLMRDAFLKQEHDKIVVSEKNNKNSEKKNKESVVTNDESSEEDDNISNDCEIKKSEKELQEKNKKLAMEYQVTKMMQSHKVHKMEEYQDILNIREKEAEVQNNKEPRDVKNTNVAGPSE